MKRRWFLVLLIALLAAALAPAQKGPSCCGTPTRGRGRSCSAPGDGVGQGQPLDPPEDGVRREPVQHARQAAHRDRRRRGPDLAEIDSYWTPIFAKPGSLVNLEPYIAPDYNSQGRPARASLQSTQYKGQSYSVPFNLSTIVMYYNKELFKAAGLDPTKAPADWQELVAFAQKLTVDKNGDGTPDQRGITFPNSANIGAVWYWLAFFFQQEGKLFNDALNAGTFNSEAGVAATNLWRQLAREKLMSLSPGSADFEAEQRGDGAVLLVGAGPLPGQHGQRPLRPDRPSEGQGGRHGDRGREPGHVLELPRQEGRLGGA